MHICSLNDVISQSELTTPIFEFLMKPYLILAMSDRGGESEILSHILDLGCGDGGQVTQ